MTLYLYCLHIINDYSLIFDVLFIAFSLMHMHNNDVSILVSNYISYSFIIKYATKKRYLFAKISLAIFLR